MEKFDPEESILAQIKPEPWDQERSVAFEVAREVIGDVIGAISGIRYHEERKEHPDNELLQRFDAEQTAAARDRIDLRYDDWDQIRALTRQYADRLRELDVLLDERTAGS